MFDLNTFKQQTLSESALKTSTFEFQVSKKIHKKLEGFYFAV